MSERLKEIKALSKSGLTHGQIAKRLGITTHTVGYHLYKKKKIGMREMVKYLYDKAKAEDEGTVQ